jgi:hypothetical protein
MNKPTSISDIYLYEAGFKDGRQAGIQEVVEWINNHGGTLDGNRTDWQAKLKEWGVSHDK